MHGYRFSKSGLREKLSEFEGGQLFIIRDITTEHLRLLMSAKAQENYESALKKIGAAPGERLAYWGGMRSWEMPGDGRKLLVRLDWLCVQRARLDKFGIRVPKWSLIEQLPLCDITISLDFTGYYFPKKGRRLKLWTSLVMTTSLGEFCRFYKKDDPDRLVWNGEEYVPAREVSSKSVTF